MDFKNALNFAATNRLTELRSLQFSPSELLGVDEYGNCLLYNAVIGAAYDVIEFLFKSGESPNRLMRIKSRVNPGVVSVYVPLFIVREYSCCSLIIDMGADVNININGKFPLYYAFSGGCIDNVRLLYEHGALINADDCEMLVRLASERELFPGNVSIDRIQGAVRRFMVPSNRSDLSWFNDF